jgi:hypothetical protein
MKRPALLFVLLSVLLSACSGSGPAAGQPDLSAAQTAQPAATSDAAFSEADLTFYLNGKPYALMTDAATLIKALGDGYELTEAASCLYVGMDRTYEYPGISINTIPKDNADYIDEIVLTDDTYATPKGVVVGGALDDIVQAYGKGYADQGGVIVYAVNGDPSDLQSPKLYFTLTDGKIDSIGFYSASNVQ